MGWGGGEVEVGLWGGAVGRGMGVGGGGGLTRTRSGRQVFVYANLLLGRSGRTCTGLGDRVGGWGGR